jgi:hypothetical protein
MEAGLHPNQQKIDVHEPEKDKITAHDFKKLRAMKKTPDGKVHNCATHVEHAVLGKGTTVSEEHAEPDAEGNIEWYTVQFEHSTQQVLTKDLTITMSEAHMHESAEEQVDEEEKKKPVSPFDYKNYKSQIPTKPGETAGFDSKKISTGTVYSRKPVKEAMSHQAATTMKHIPNASPALKKAAKDIKPGIAGYRDRIDMLKAGGVKEEVEMVYEANIQPTAAKSRSHIGNLSHPTTNPVAHPSSGKEIGLITKQPDGKYHAHPSSVKLSHSQGGTFDTKDQAHQHIRNAHAKAIKTGTLSDRWKKQEKLPQFAKEEVEQKEYTFAEYLDAARTQYGDEDAVLVANEAFKNQDITLFADQSQSPEA